MGKVAKILSKIFWTIAVSFLVVCIGAAIFSMFQKDEKAPVEEKRPVVQQKPRSETIEYELATVDKGYVSRDDITITRFKSLLQQLDATYAENKQKIADCTVVAQKMLKDDYGIKETMLNIMEGLNQIYPTKVNPSYAKHATAYCILRGTGSSHQQALSGIEIYLKSIGRF